MEFDPSSTPGSTTTTTTTPATSAPAPGSAAADPQVIAQSCQLAVVNHLAHMSYLVCLGMCHPGDAWSLIPAATPGTTTTTTTSATAPGVASVEPQVIPPSWQCRIAWLTCTARNRYVCVCVWVCVFRGSMAFGPSGTPGNTTTTTTTPATSATAPESSCC